MNIFFDAINIILVIVALVYVIFLYLIYAKSKNLAIKYSYSLAILSILFWTISMIFYRSAPEINSLLWCKILYISATFTASSFLIFSIIFPYGKLPSLKVFGITLVTNLFVILLVAADNLVIKSVDILVGSEKIINWGNFYIVYTAYISIFFLIGLVILYKKYRSEHGSTRSQIKLIFLGYLIGSNLAMFTNMAMLSWGDFRFNWLGQVTSIIMAAFTVYAIIAHRLMDIKLVMRKYSVFIASMMLTLMPALAMKYYIVSYFPVFQRITDIIILFFSIWVFPIIKDYISQLANRYFFSSLYDSRKVIAQISEKLRSTLDINIIYDHIYKNLDDAMHLKSFGILSYEEKKNRFVTKYNINFNIGRRVNFEQNSYMREMYVKNNKPVVISEYKSLYYNKNTQETIDMFEAMNIELLCPLVVKNRVVGLMVFGGKESGDPFNDEDLQVLNIVASQSAIAIENAMLYEETKNFSVRMENEVKLATADLRAANERLKKLDEAKSEFISIASHQLRTPLTVIKGYISMIMEGSFGSVSMVVKDSLSKVYQSNERLISLVENLLNISRIESGHLKFNFETVKLDKIVAGMVEELSSTAASKGVTLDYKAPTKELPDITIDVEKIRQVIMNLIDNAIKYTNKGKIGVSLCQKNDKICFTVSDRGIGINPDDIPNLFKKFARGTGAMLEHTEGTGLGLFVAKQMIDAHKGNIWVESKGEGKGAKFCFELPISTLNGDLTKLSANTTI